MLLSRNWSCHKQHGDDNECHVQPLYYHDRNNSGRKAPESMNDTKPGSNRPDRYRRAGPCRTSFQLTSQANHPAMTPLTTRLRTPVKLKSGSQKITLDSSKCGNTKLPAKKVAEPARAHPKRFQNPHLVAGQANHESATLSMILAMLVAIRLRVPVSSDSLSTFASFLARPTVVSGTRRNLAPVRNHRSVPERSWTTCGTVRLCPIAYMPKQARRNKWSREPLPTSLRLLPAGEQGAGGGQHILQLGGRAPLRHRCAGAPVVGVAALHAQRHQ